MTLRADELWNLIQSPGLEQKLRRTEVMKSRLKWRITGLFGISMIEWKSKKR